MTFTLECHILENYWQQTLDRHVFFDISTLPKHSKMAFLWDAQKDNELIEYMRGNN